MKDGERSRMEKVRKDKRKYGWTEGKEERKEWSEEKWSKNRNMDV